MGILDKAVAAVTPEPSQKDMGEARGRARALADPGDWLAQVIDQHEQVEAAFARVKATTTASDRRAEQENLAALLTGHSLAEEAVLYPAMALHDQKGHSGEAYTEQSAAKVQVAALDELEPMSKDYDDKLEHLRAAVAHHVYEEENKWFPELRRIEEQGFQAKLTRRYQDEFERYNADAIA